MGFLATRMRAVLVVGLVVCSLCYGIQALDTIESNSASLDAQASEVSLASNELQETEDIIALAEIDAQIQSEVEAATSSMAEVEVDSESLMDKRHLSNAHAKGQPAKLQKRAKISRGHSAAKAKSAHAHKMRFENENDGSDTSNANAGTSDNSSPESQSNTDGSGTGEGTGEPPVEAGGDGVAGQAPGAEQAKAMVMRFPANDVGGGGGGNAAGGGPPADKRVIIMDLPPGTVGLASDPKIPPSPIPYGPNPFGSLRAKQVYPPYPSPSLVEDEATATDNPVWPKDPNRKGRPMIFDFPPGYFGFGGSGGQFQLVNPYDHPANPLNLNPFSANPPKMGYVKTAVPNGFQPPGPAVGINQFGGLRAKQISPSYDDAALHLSPHEQCENCEFQ